VAVAFWNKLVARRANLIFLVLILFLLILLKEDEEEDDFWLPLGRTALYRRFVIRRASESSWRLELAHAVQNPILQYSRLKSCAT
jgi:hypothetical protein